MLSSDGIVKTVYIGSAALSYTEYGGTVSARKEDTLLIVSSDGSHSLPVCENVLVFDSSVSSAECAFMAVMASSAKIRSFVNGAAFVLIVTDLSGGFAVGAASAASSLAEKAGAVTVGVMPAGGITVRAVQRNLTGNVSVRVSSEQPLSYCGAALTAMLNNCLDENCGGFTVREMKNYLCPSVGICCFSTGCDDGKDKAKTAAQKALDNLPPAVKIRTTHVLSETVIAPDGSLSDLNTTEKTVSYAMSGTRDVIPFSNPDENAGGTLTVNIIAVGV